MEQVFFVAITVVDRFAVVARFDWWAGWRVRDSQHQPSCDRNRLVVSYRGLTDMGLLLQNQERRRTKMISFLVGDPCKPCQCYWEKYLSHPKRYATMPVVLFHRPDHVIQDHCLVVGCLQRWNTSHGTSRFEFMNDFSVKDVVFPFAKSVLYSFDHRNVVVFSNLHIANDSMQFSSAIYTHVFANGTVANYLSHNLNSEDLNKCCWTPNVPTKQHQALPYVGGMHNDGILTEYLGGGSVVF